MMAFIIRHITQLVCASRSSEKIKRGQQMRDPAIIEHGAVVVRDSRIDWVGPTSQLPPLPPDTAVLDATGKTVLPGLIDSHTHLIFAGTREDEFELRLQGATYQEISARGGGINATVRRVREATKDDLKESARRRLRRLLAFGVTTVEVKS